MTVIEVRTEQGKLIEVVEVSLSEATHRIMLTDDQGHQVFIHHAAWMDIIKVVGKLLMEEERKANAKEKH
jgi:hypothetical protein